MSKIISQKFADKLDQILERWKEKVRQDKKIASATDLSDSALSDSVPKVLEAIASVLDQSPSETEDFETVASASLEHGTQRARAGYDAAEITREYRLLRQTIFSLLEPDLLELSSQDYNRSYRLMNAVVDEAISQCFNRFVEEQIYKQESLKEELILNNQELARLLNMSRDSFSLLAHEIKTPLNSIMGYSQLLLRDSQTQATEELNPSNERLERVLRASRELLQLVNDSLEIARCDSGNTNLQIVSTDVRPIINSTLEIVEPLAQAKNLEIAVDCDRAPAQVATDPFRLQQILTNLLSNAVRYTDTGSIHVSCQALPNEQWSLTVKDTGIGIAPEQQAQIFEPFSPTTRREGSTGLGLAIVARLIKLLQGKIDLVSTLGEGTQMTLTFPLELE